LTFAANVAQGGPREGTCHPPLALIHREIWTYFVATICRDYGSLWHPQCVLMSVVPVTYGRIWPWFCKV